MGLNEEKEIVRAFLLVLKDTNGSAKPSVDLVTLSNTQKTAMSQIISLWNGFLTRRRTARHLRMASSHNLDSDLMMVAT